VSSPTNNFALDRAAMGMVQSLKDSGLDQQFDQVYANTGNGSTPDGGLRQDVGGLGSFPPGISVPADDFTPSAAGATGQGTQVPRDQEAKKDLVTGMVPLYAEGDNYCVIQLVPDDGGGGQGETFEDFILTSVTQVKAERYQIYETFKLPILYVMDKAPEIYPFQGYFFTGRDRSGSVWHDKFMVYYETKLRATQLADQSLKAFFSYQGRLVVGYVLSIQVPESSDSPVHCPFTFNVYVTDTKYYNA
jgi:hypothetical protein